MEFRLLHGFKLQVVPFAKNIIFGQFQSFRHGWHPNDMQGLVIYLGRELRQLVRLGVYPTKGLQLREVLVAAKREFREAVICERKKKC